MTKSHDDRINLDGSDYGYSIRVGKTLPSNAANLAYVYSPKATPKANLLINDVSTKIVDNTVSAKLSAETMVYPDDTFLLRELNKPFTSPTANVVLTDEYSVPATTQDSPSALYYKAELKGYFDAKGADVVYWPGGYVERPITEIMSYSQINQAKLASVGSLLYMGNKIRITKLDGTAVDSTCKFKFQLIQQSGAGVPANAFKVVVYTNFRGNAQDTYVIRYERYNEDGTHTADFVEILNAYTFFTRVEKDELDLLADNPKQGDSWKPDLLDKKYAVEETQEKEWAVYSPAQVIIADNVTRPADQFQYRIRGKLRAKLSSSQTGEINIGLIYINETIFDAQDLRDVLKKMFETSYKPPYLDFINPHPSGTDLPKENAAYWNIDLTMPADYLHDYDLIIMTGYGTTDMSMYNDAFRNYLENGGTLWIDNAGTGTSVLQLQNFFTNIGWSTTANSTGFKQGTNATDTLSIPSLALNRLYLLNKDQVNAGYEGVNPKFVFGVGESASLWTPVVKYSNGDSAIVTRTAFTNGTMILSNCGIFRTLANKLTTDDIKLAMNIVLATAEQKWVSTPWLHDYVYHRDNLFKEEYLDGDHDVYVDDRDDNDSTQIVAKKMINKTVKDALIPYMPSSYYKSKGTFIVEVNSDSVIPVTNGDFEVGTYDPVTGAAVTTWTEAYNDFAIPGWSTYSDYGSPVFKHVSSISQRGTKALSIEATNPSQAVWYTELGTLDQGTYKYTMWVKTADVAGSGVTVNIVALDNTNFVVSQPMLGTMDWTEVSLTFTLEQTTDLQGCIVMDNTTGTVWVDHVSFVSVGSVYMTPTGDGSAPLYAYAMRAQGDVFDLQSEGFSSADVTTYDPEIKINYTIKSFVYAWNNTTFQYVRQYGNSKSYATTIRRSDGMMSLGLLTTQLPALQAGAAWADKNKVFFEIVVGDVDPSDKNSQFVNVGFFNTRGGKYFYSEAGENVIGYSELFDGKQTEAYVIIQAWTTYYTIRATKRRYSVRVQDDERIYLEYPATIDDRDSWLVRIHNGSFAKRGLQYDEYEEFKDFYNGRQFGVYSYSIPEYQRQFFTPGLPYRRVRKEVAEYIDDSTIRVQRNPLYVQNGKARMETMSDLNGGKLIFKASQDNWVKTSVVIYRDTNGDGSFFEVTGGVDIDYANGIVVFDSPVNGVVKADYNYNNLSVFKRTYANSKVKKESLQLPTKTQDHRTFISDNRNWLLYPSPVLYVLPDGSTEYQILPVDTYKIDYDAGTVEFKGDTFDRIYVDYNYSIDKPITVKDYDIQSGLIYLSTPISFKDEVYVNYYYEENFFEYRGYYDTDARKFIQLDLNPLEGHYCTLPVYRTDPATNNQIIVKYDNVPTAKLMNKEVYIYLLPRSGSFGVDNNYVVRHCYSEAEWLKIRKTMPGIALLLGIVKLRESATVDDVVVMDTRVRGGGLKKNITREVIKKKATSSLSYWDMGPWDGTAYYKNGVLIIQLPKDILVSNGGQFSEKQVSDIIKKYVAFGTYYIVEYVDMSAMDSTLYLQGASFPNTLNK